jgi:hypothetical protein
MAMATITRRLAAAVCAAGLGLSGSGCATMVLGGDRDQRIKIISDPPGAVVTVDGQPHGVTPAAVPLSRETDHKVVLVADGYEPAELTLKRYVNPWLLGNVVFGGPVGLAVDVVTDSTHILVPNILDVTLKPAAALPPGTPVGTPAPK